MVARGCFAARFFVAGSTSMGWSGRARGGGDVAEDDEKHVMGGKAGVTAAMIKALKMSKCLVIVYSQLETFKECLVISKQMPKEAANQSAQ